MLFEFTCAEHEDYGSTGWRPKWMPNADPLGGMGVAHDVIEHFRPDDGSIFAELQAFGAMLHTRHNGGYWHTKGSFRTRWSEHTSGEFVSDLLVKHYDDWRLPRSPNHYVRCDDWVEDELNNFSLQVREHIRAEYDCEEVSRYLHRFTLTEAQCRHAFRLGYRRACKRFGRRNPTEVAHDFLKIEGHADKLLAHAEQGDVLEVRYEFKTGKRSVEMRSYSDDYA